jgi:hypothetical protein
MQSNETVIIENKDDSKEVELVEKDEFDELKDDLTQFKNSFDYVKSRNLYNPLELEDGLVGADGKSNGVEGYSMTGFIPFAYGQTAYFSRYKIPVSVYQYAFYDANKNLLSRTSRYETSVTAPTNCAYLRIGMVTSNFPNGFQIEYDEITDYQEYFSPYPISKHNYITVSKDGKCDYMTVTEAVANANDGDTIFILPALYEDEVIEGWGKELHLVGFDKKNTVIRNSTDSYSTPPLEIAKGSVENLTITATRNDDTEGTHAYAVHVEDDILYKGNLIFNNCCFKAANGACVGIGMRGGCDIEFNNCELISTGFNNYIGTSGYALYFHDTVDDSQVGDSKIALKNCKLIGTHESGVVIRMDSNGLDGSRVLLEFINNVLFNEHYSTTYLSLHNNSGIANSDWNGLKGYKNRQYSYGNNAAQLNYNN